MARKSAECGAGCTKTAHRKSNLRRSAEFLSGLSEARRVVFVAHIHPDPDSLASMMGLSYLVETQLHKPTLLTCDGRISRAENRAMVDLLGVHLIPIEQWKPLEGDAVVMVDSQPNTGRHNLPPQAPLFAVLDHHTTPGTLCNVPFIDVRTNIGATASLVTYYLMEQQVEIPTLLATALLYGVETEVNGYPREASALDDEVMVYLYPLADRDLLARIRNARVPARNFECLLHALQQSFIYDNLIVGWVGDLPQPELVAEVCDFLIRFEEVDYAVCAGVHENQMILSMRAAVPDANAGAILQKVVGKLGRAGGHDRRAGGAIPLASTSMNAIDQVQKEIRRRLLKELGIEDCRGQRLVSRREMLHNLGA
jgi:nanoRNase/pAp phosphatase (c-di-AMP/oligoRNAs hydrolase)